MSPLSFHDCTTWCLLHKVPLACVLIMWLKNTTQIKNKLQTQKQREEILLLCCVCVCVCLSLCVSIVFVCYPLAACSTKMHLICNIRKPKLTSINIYNPSASLFSAFVIDGYIIKINRHTYSRISLSYYLSSSTIPLQRPQLVKNLLKVFTLPSCH